jgi:methyl-accepting chemotaxis protein
VGSYVEYQILIRKHLQEELGDPVELMDACESINKVLNFDMQAIGDAFLLSTLESIGLNISSIESDGVSDTTEHLTDAKLMMKKFGSQIIDNSNALNTVAAAAEEMTAAIKEIAQNTGQASSVANNAVSLAESTSQVIGQLAESSQRIAGVLKVIMRVAGQTNLLALNATIEAARAGQAGKGFAVVANEVKELAKETAGATGNIREMIEIIQTEAESASKAVADIREAIHTIDNYTNAIAAAVEQQTATTNEIARNVSETAKGTSEIARAITAGFSNGAGAAVH